MSAWVWPALVVVGASFVVWSALVAGRRADEQAGLLESQQRRAAHSDFR